MFRLYFNFAMNKIFAAIGFSLICQAVLAQVAIGEIIDPNFQKRGIWKNEKNLEGSPFFIDRWISGKVVTKVGETFDNVAVKYEAYTDALNFKSKEGAVLAIPSRKIDYFEFTDLETDTNYLFRQIETLGYFQVLYEGKTILYKKIKKKIRVGKEENGYNSSAEVTDKIYDVIQIFLELEGSGELVEVKNKGSLHEVLGKRDEMKKFMKSNKIKFDEDSDLVSVVKYYDTL